MEAPVFLHAIKTMMLVETTYVGDLIFFQQIQPHLMILELKIRNYNQLFQDVRFQKLHHSVIQSCVPLGCTYEYRQCFDNNYENGDGCDENCQFEEDFFCTANGCYKVDCDDNQIYNEKDNICEDCHESCSVCSEAYKENACLECPNSSAPIDGECPPIATNGK